MGRGEATRERIIERAAGLFNRRGVAGSSVADVMAATGLQKGGIYRHFESKEALALEAFDFAVGEMTEEFRRALAGKRGAVERLDAMIGVYAGLAVAPPVPGGCPLLNAGVEHADADGALRERVREAMAGFLALVRGTIRRGQADGELRPEVDADAVASFMVAAIEGGVLLSRLYGDREHMARVAAILSQQVGGLQIRRAVGSGRVIR